MIASTPSETICLNRAQFSAYSCLCYFQIFHHPLKASEIAEFSDTPIHVEMVESALYDLLELKMIFKQGDFYSLDKEIRLQIVKRLRSELRYSKKLRTFKRYANFISRFPYVKFVGISGSCSKGLFEEDSDVDYFVITAPGRLWICRTFLILFKKIILFNSKKYFCLNYFIDSNSLEIPDKNIFVAHELKTLIPINNEVLFKRLLQANTWTNTYLPNKSSYNRVFLNSANDSKYFFRVIELLFSGKFGNVIDRWCESFTFKTWKKRFTGLEAKEFELNFRSQRNVSKHHPRGFQKRVIDMLEAKLDKIKVVV